MTPAKEQQKYLYPILSPENGETKETILTRWDIFDTLEIPVQEKLSSKYTAEKMEKIGRALIFNSQQVGCITIAIRKYYFGELKIEDFPFHLAKEIPIDLTKAKEITAMVLREIIQDDSQEKAAQAQLENLTLAEALRNFPEIGEQLVTSDRINVLNFPEPARPSVKNWIADYTSVLGRDTHDAIVRGNFIFHSANGKKLNSIDRQKLAHLLKSFDEKTPLTVNKASRQIVFPAFSAPAQQSAPPRTAPAPERSSAPNKPLWYPQAPQRTAPERKPIIQPEQPKGNISFSSPQKLGYENLEPYRINPVSGRMQPTNNGDSSDKRAAGKNVVNLKET